MCQVSIMKTFMAKLKQLEVEVLYYKIAAVVNIL